jgi:DnaJ-class molecular chaperone
MIKCANCNGTGDEQVFRGGIHVNNATCTTCGGTGAKKEPKEEPKPTPAKKKWSGVSTTKE